MKTCNKEIANDMFLPLNGIKPKDGHSLFNLTVSL